MCVLQCFACSNTKVFPKDDEIRAELGKSMQMAIQVFSQLPWKIPNIVSLAKFVFYGMNHEISAILTTTYYSFCTTTYPDFHLSSLQ